MKRVEVNGKTVVVRKCGDHFVAHFEGMSNKVFGGSEEECLERLRKRLSVPVKVKYEKGEAA